MATNNKNFVIKNGLEVTNGKIGVGTNSPSDKLHVVGDIRVEDSDPTIKLIDSDGTLQSSHIHQQQGNLYFDLRNNTGDGNLLVRGMGGGSATEKLRITSDGKVRVPDGGKFTAGADDDLQIYHNGTDSYIDDAGIGSLHLRSATLSIQNGLGNKTSAIFNAGGGQEFRHDNSIKLETTSTGATVTGTALATALSTGASGTGINISTDTISGPATLTLDPAGVGDNTGTVIIAGDLQVDGTTTTINSTTLTVDDKNLVLASGAANNAAADGAGITIDTADATLLYKATPDAWVFNKKVGIGTDAPGGGMLEVHGSTALGRFVSSGGFSYGLTIENVKSSPADGLSILALMNTGQGAANASVGLLHKNGQQTANNLGGAHAMVLANYRGPLLFGTNNGTHAYNERMRIDSDGNVGIGTDTPTTKLQIKAGSNVTTDYPLTITNSAVNYGMQFGAYGASNKTFGATTIDYKIEIGGDLILDTTGNVGIGTDNPSGELHIYQPTGQATTLKIEGGSPELWFKDVDETPIFRQIINANGWNVQPGTGSVTSPTWGSVALTVDESGNVGIGTTDPSSKLDVHGTGTVARFGDLDNVDQLDIRISSGYPTLYCPSSLDTLQLASLGSVQVAINSNNNSTESFRIVADGKDSGGSEIFKIDTEGNFKVSQTNPGWTNSTDHPILMWDFKTGVGDMMYMASGGNTPIADQMALVISDDHGFKVGKSGWDGSDSDISSTNEFFRVTPSGNVGIGTDNPSELLTLGSTATSNHYIRVNSANNSDSGIKFYSDLSATKGYAAGYRGNGNLFFIQSDNAGTTADRLVINDSGNVGIGTDSPQAKLNVAGDTLFFAGTGAGTVNIVSAQNATNAGNKIAFFGAGRFDTDEEFAYIKPYFKSNGGGPGNVQSGELAFGTSGSDRLLIDSTGNVGIGTVSPSDKLHVKGTIRLDGTSAALNNNYSLIYQNSSSTIDYGLQLRHYQGDTGDVDASITIGGNGATREDNIIFYRSNGSGASTETMRIDESGNVGIGTDNPGAKLQVTTANTTYLKLTSTTLGDRFVVDAYGCLGLDTAEANIEARLHITTASDYGILVKDILDDTVFVADDGNSRVGVGTLSPTGLFEVESDNGADPVHITRGGTVSSDQVGIKFKATTTRYFGMSAGDPYWHSSSNLSLGENLFQVVKDIPLGSSDNLNSLTDGYYTWITPQPTNSPGDPYMAMLQLSDNNQKIQMAFGSSSSGRFYVRRADSGTFYTWTEFARINETSNFTTTPQINGSDILSTATGLSTNPSGPIYWSSNTLTTFDPPGGGTGTDTATDVVLGLASGNRIAGWYNGYIRTLLEWNESSDITIGQGGTTLIGGIDLLPGSAGNAKVNGSRILTTSDEGSGNGLDADTVDGIQGASFLRSDANDTATGSITFSANTSISNEKYIGYSNTYNYKPRITGGIGTRSEMISAANLLLHADADGSGTAEFLSIRAGGGTANELKIESKTVAAGQSSSALTYNGGQVWHAGNDGAGSGLDADTLDGAQPNTSAGNNTIVKRNSSGYIFANYFNTTPNDVSSGVTKVCVETGNDGYIRHGTAAAIRTFINVESGATADQTAAEILTAIKTVDGSGSGLDADLLDGQNSSYYWNQGSTGLGGTNRITSTSNFNNSLPSGFYQSDSASNMPGTNWHNMLNVRHSSTSNDHGFQLSMSYYGEHLYSRTYSGGSNANNGTYTTWAKQWSDRNDGAGSGLDADLLDGVNSGSFLRSDATDTFSGNITFSSYLISNARDKGLFGVYDSTKTDQIWSMGTAYKNHSSGTDFGNLYGLAYKHTNNSTGGTMGGGHQMVWVKNGTPRGAIGDDQVWHATAMKVGSNTVWHAGNDGIFSGLDADLLAGELGSFYAPIDTPSFSGNLTIPDKIIHAGDTDTYIQFNADNRFRVVCQGGEVQEWGNNYTLINDSDTLRLGTGSDFQMYFSGADTYFRNYAQADGDIIFQGENSAGSNQTILIMKTDGTRTYNILYENGAERFRTDSAGVKVTGIMESTSSVTLGGELNLIGTADANKYIDCRVGSNSLSIRKTTGGDAGHETMAKFVGDGGVELYHNNVKKFETTSTGATLDDTLTISGDGTQMLLHPGTTNETVIVRNDGTNLYFLLSAAGAAPTGTWNGLRPFYINTGTGMLHSNNGQDFAGGLTTSNITLDPSGILNHNTDDSYDKIRVWESSSYTIGMKSAQTHGRLNDYAMTFTMSNESDRGFLWRDTAHDASGGAMSLSTDGGLAVSRGINTGGGETDTGWSDHPLHVYNSWQTGQNSSYNTVYIDSDWSGTAAFSANRTQYALRVDQDNSKSNTTSVSGNRHTIIAVGATSDSTQYTHDNRGLYGFAKSTGAGSGIGTQTVMGAYTYAQGYLSSGAANIYGLHSLAYRGGSTSGGTMYAVYGRAQNTTDGSGKSGNAVGGYFEVECDEDTIADAKGVFSHIDRDAGTITTGTLFYGSYAGTVGTKWGVYVTGETKNYFSGNVGIGATDPVAKLDVNGNIHCTKIAAGTASNPGTNVDICLGADNDTGFQCPSDGNLKFWCNNAEVASWTDSTLTFVKASTFNGRVTINGHLDLPDNEVLYFGTGDDVEFFCNGSHMYMDLNSGIGNFYIRDGSTTRYTFNDNGSFTATGNVTAYSDIKLKANIEPIANPLDKVNQINGVTFDRIDTPELGRQMGVIAQDVEKVCPELVSTDDEGTKSVAYGNMVGLLIESIKEQQKQIDELRQEIKNLKGDK